MSLLDLIRESGVIGAGGAGFPTHVKLNTQAEYLLLNGAECEPLLRVDQLLMAMYPDEVLQGFYKTMQLIGAEKGIIGVKKKHEQVISLLQSRVKALNINTIEVQGLPDVYPAGDEQILVYELTGRVVPELGIPIQVGCVVINSETALNINKAAQGYPVTEKYITVSGDVPTPITVKVPIGTPIRCVLEQSGIRDFTGYSVIDGGPMMGPLLKDLDGFVTKKSKGYIILKETHNLIQKKSVNGVQARRVNRATCEQCRMCTDLCPRFLIGHHIEPHKTMRIMNYGIDDPEGKLRASLCCQCNLCDYFSCPAGLYPRLANSFFKDEMAIKNSKYTSKPENEKNRMMRDYRQVPSKRLIGRLGLRPYDLSAPFEDRPCEPEVVKILTQQHVGAPAIPIVSPNDHVGVGQLIGKIPEGKLGATIHASVAGTVLEVEDGFIKLRRDSHD